MNNSGNEEGHEYFWDENKGDVRDSNNEKTKQGEDSPHQGLIMGDELEEH